MTHNHESESHDQDITDLLTFEQAGAQLKVSRKSIERFIKAGILPVIRLGPRTLRISQSDLDDFINRMREDNS